MTEIAICKYRIGPATGQNTIYIEERGDGKWAVTHLGSACLNINGNWEYEPIPSSRGNEFISRTRFTLEEAMRLAQAEYDRGGWAA